VILSFKHGDREYTQQRKDSRASKLIVRHMERLHDIGLEQILTFTQPRIHEDIVHLVNRRFHRLMLRNVDLNMCFTSNMDPDNGTRFNYVASLITSLNLIRKIHMLNLSSEWATRDEANHVLTRFAFPMHNQPQHDNSEHLHSSKNSQPRTFQRG